VTESAVALIHHSTISYWNRRHVEQATVAAYPAIIAPCLRQRHVLSAQKCTTGTPLFFCHKSIVCILPTGVFKELINSLSVWLRGFSLCGLSCNTPDTFTCLQLQKLPASPLRHPLQHSISRGLILGSQSKAKSLGFAALFIVQISKLLENTMFGKLGLCLSSSKGGGRHLLCWAP
jgi:hypothetical protein